MVARQGTQAGGEHEADPIAAALHRHWWRSTAHKEHTPVKFGAEAGQLVDELPKGQGAAQGEEFVEQWADAQRRIRDDAPF